MKVGNIRWAALSPHGPPAGLTVAKGRRSCVEPLPRGRSPCFKVNVPLVKERFSLNGLSFAQTQGVNTE
jgi:hypothetical protein